MRIRSRDYNNGHTYIMGILNVTPDSFSDGGEYFTPKKALDRALAMIEEGADIIDIGGESTRPGYTMISDDEEIDRVCPVIELIREHTDIPISLDTYKSKVAREGIKYGADLINDIWGLKYDPDMACIIAESGKSCCLMHNKKEPFYDDLIEDIKSELLESVEIALSAGIDRDKIILDPGVGFAKDYHQNLSVLKHLKDFTQTGYPILLGASRKSVIGNALGLDKDNRLEGTLATSIYAVMAGCLFVRVHDISANARAIKMTEEIINA